jgi:hypothetical protein
VPPLPWPASSVNWPLHRRSNQPGTVRHFVGRECCSDGLRRSRPGGRGQHSGTAPFASPFPDWSSRSPPALATLPNPLSAPLIAYLLGSVTADAGLYRSALAQLNRAAASARDDQASIVECMISSCEAELCAAQGDSERAIPLALFGLRMFVLDQSSNERDFLSTISVGFRTSHPCGWAPVRLCDAFEGRMSRFPRVA